MIIYNPELLFNPLLFNTFYEYPLNNKLYPVSRK